MIHTTHEKQVNKQKNIKCFYFYLSSTPRHLHTLKQQLWKSQILITVFILVALWDVFLNLDLCLFQRFVILYRFPMDFSRRQEIISHWSLAWLEIRTTGKAYADIFRLHQWITNGQGRTNWRCYTASCLHLLYIYIKKKKDLMPSSMSLIRKFL